MMPTLRSISSSSFRAFAAAGTCAALGLFVSLSTTSLVAQTAASNDANSAQKQVVANLLDTLGKTHSPRQAEISPDGSTVAWVAAMGKIGSRIHLTPLGGHVRPGHVGCFRPGNPERDTPRGDDLINAAIGKQRWIQA